MKPFAGLLLCLVLSSTKALCDTEDPIKDYLANREYPHTRGDQFYADDEVYVLDLDLRGDGRTQRLVSSSLDGNGKAGTMWTVFKKVGKHWKSLGRMTFHGERFYLGKIDELDDRRGVVDYSSGGAGRGVFMASYLVGSKVRETKIGDAELPELVTGKGKGMERFERYLDEKERGRRYPEPRTLNIKELAKSYDIKSDPRTFVESLVGLRHEGPASSTSQK